MTDIVNDVKVHCTHLPQGSSNEHSNEQNTVTYTVTNRTQSHTVTNRTQSHTVTNRTQ